ncbi:DNA-binding NtrC family response regulator [Breoghania corrubedonensis]|uniref:DNA-binding NtrC family response regulator n=1 Tax=Breoghania corrubedonensis TaxID=665038 RepID=A0A2T5VC67_9HYPH|nr:sigma-54 dependent transcriptional regulator [Breoghania corrubedonensis]PTW61339.1 DNA-binding NtrC family response regulator [Breoghania corrubedonensis]
MTNREFGNAPVLAVGEVLENDARRSALREAGIAVETAPDGATALKALEGACQRVVLVAEELDDMDGAALIRMLAERDLSHTVVLVLTARGAVDAARVRGAFDFLVEPVEALRLSTTLRNARERAILHAAVEDLSPDMGPAGYFGFIGRSVAMRSVYRMVESVARSRATVFITGESGTGKEVCAEAIHQAGPRAQEPFVFLDCAHLPADRLEAEIFGHAPDAGPATTFGPGGAALRADGGTLFIRDVCALDIELQAKLLHFLQTGRFTPHGTGREMAVDVRVICATDCDPMQEVTSGRFREDLFYRLHVLPIHLPPLREREGDAVDIAVRMLREAAAEAGKSFRSLTPQARAMLASYDWPGNVRELQAVIHCAVEAHEGEVLTADMLPARISGETGDASGVAHPAGATAPEAEPQADPAGGPEPGPQGAEGDTMLGLAVGETLAEMERRFIEATIEACNGSLPRAARTLGVSPSTLYRKRESWGTPG